jgi:hypothetical protein
MSCEVTLIPSQLRLIVSEEGKLQFLRDQLTLNRKYECLDVHDTLESFSEEISRLEALKMIQGKREIYSWNVLGVIKFFSNQWKFELIRLCVFKGTKFSSSDIMLLANFFESEDEKSRLIVMARPNPPYGLGESKRIIYLLREDVKKHDLVKKLFSVGGYFEPHIKKSDFNSIIRNSLYKFPAYNLFGDDISDVDDLFRSPRVTLSSTQRTQESSVPPRILQVPAKKSEIKKDVIPTDDDLRKNVKPGYPGRECSVCLENEPNWLLMPCRHIKCGPCIAEIHKRGSFKCPDCRVEIDNFIQFFS